MNEARRDWEFDNVIAAVARASRRPQVPEDPSRVRARRRAELGAGAKKTTHEKAVERRKKRKRGGHK